MNNKPSPEDWSFVLRHAAIISSAIRRICPAHLDYMDARQDFVLYLASRVRTYDPTLGKPSTWINMKARGWATDQRRQAQRRKREIAAATERVMVSTKIPDALTMERRAQLSIMLDRAEPRHREAAASVLQDHTVSEVPAQIGKTYQARNQLLRRLGDSYAA